MLAVISIRNQFWQVYVAITFEEITQGLANTNYIPVRTGMLFVLPTTQQITVSTQYMFFPIDIIFIDENMQIKEVIKGVPAGANIRSSYPVKYFLEVNAGEAGAIAVGDIVTVAVVEEVIPPATVNLASTDTLTGIFSVALTQAVAGEVVKGLI